jgi:hypothetical protein
MRLLSGFVLAAAVVGCGVDGGGGDAGIVADGGVFGSDGDPTGDAAGPYATTFDGDADSWPAPWVEAGGVARADVVGGRARLAPMESSYSLARMHLPGDAADADIVFTVEFDDLVSQGVGFYARQNGGYLGQSDPHGQGYAVFVEGFRGAPAIGVWREVDGDEQELEVAQNPVANMTSGVTYAVRFAVSQQDASSTRLRCRIWEADTAEPTAWAIDTTDSTAVLQNLSGGYAADAWSSINPNNPGTIADVYIDDIRIGQL